MKYSTTLFLLLLSLSCFSQNLLSIPPQNHKGELYFYWGWNRGWFGESDINFKSANYDFQIKNVVAKDRQSSFNLETYFNPSKITIPQFNFRIGYFISDKYNISFGLDHMKYVVQEGQTVKISGNINDVGSIHNGTYSNNDIRITNDFLRFEHTDGLNYINLGFRRIDEIFQRKNIRLGIIEGIETGILFPKTNTAILGMDGYDDFNVSGYGVNVVLGLNITLYDFFFIQSELKGGYMDMPDIKISYLAGEGANQSFFFSQLNIVFGAAISLRKNAQKQSKTKKDH